MRVWNNTEIPGTPQVSVHIPELDSELEEYCEDLRWKNAVPIAIIGKSASGKTGMLLALEIRIEASEPRSVGHWTEADYLADLRNLWRFENLTKNVNKATDVLWDECLAWDKHMKRLVGLPVLGFDDVGYTPNAEDQYRVETMLRGRQAAGLTN